jgi:YebC/PmpR family DNA-binding regulatory protein
MAGHSKWKNIQHRKGRQDALRGKIFTKISREIFVAVKRGGDDPSTNPALRHALQKARQNNMPQSNIENTIKKANGDVEGLRYEEVLYEGYGPGGVAILVEGLTDNRNRTAAEVRHIFSKNGGSLGETGCVSFLFERKGMVRFHLGDNGLDEDTALAQALDAGAEDVEFEDGYAIVFSAPDDFDRMQKALEESGLKLEQAELTRVPVTTVSLSEEDAANVERLVEMLEDNDDVQNVYANLA